jgi:DNA invertase Pin-like site-specific DNA recombinase
MNVIFYTRVTTEIQRHYLNEVRQQEGDLTRWCEEYKHTIVGTFHDTDAGPLDRRPGWINLLRTLDLLSSNKDCSISIDMIIVTDWNRLSYSNKELNIIINKINDKGVKILAMNQFYDDEWVKMTSGNKKGKEGLK